MAEKSGKYGDLIRQAREPENQETIKPEETVNLCCKVPKRLRQHWAAEAKRKGISMTEVMVKALEAEFGLPD